MSFVRRLVLICSSLERDQLKEESWPPWWRILEWWSSWPAESFDRPNDDLQEPRPLQHRRMVDRAKDLYLKSERKVLIERARLLHPGCKWRPLESYVKVLGLQSWRMLEPQLQQEVS